MMIKEYLDKKAELEDLEIEVSNKALEIVREAERRARMIRAEDMYYEHNHMIEGLDNHNLAVSIQFLVSHYEKLNRADTNLLCFYDYCLVPHVEVTIDNYQYLDIPVEFVEYDEDIVDWVRRIYELGNEEFNQYREDREKSVEECERVELARLLEKYGDR